MSATVQIPTTDIQGTALGVLWYGSTAGAGAELAGNTTTTKKFLRSTGVAGVATAPAWDTIVAGDLPGSLAITAISNLTTNGFVQTSGAVGTLGVIADPLAATHGGTGFASYTVGDLLYASTTTALSKLAAVAARQVLTSAGTGTAPAWSANPIVNTLSLYNNAMIPGSGAGGTVFYMVQADATQNNIFGDASLAAGFNIVGRVCGGTLASPANTDANRIIMFFGARGYGNGAYTTNVAQVQLNASSTWSNTDFSTNIVLAVTAAGTTATSVTVTITGASMTLTQSTDSSSVSTGSIITAGGVGIAKSLTVGTGFGCNSKTPQTAFASGGAAPAGGTGTAAGGWDTAAHRDSAITLLNNIRSALVANGIMS